MKRTGDPYDVEAVHIGLLDPPLELVRDMFRRSDNSGTQTTDSDMLGDREFRPLGHSWRRLRPRFNR